MTLNQASFNTWNVFSEEVVIALGNHLEASEISYNMDGGRDDNAHRNRKLNYRVIICRKDR